MRSPFYLFAFVLLISLLAGDTAAKTHVQSGGSVDRQRTFRYSFTVTGEGRQSLKATVSNKADRGGSRLRIRFFTKSPQGGRREINELRIQINGDYKETTGTFTLEPGTYKVEVFARHSTYNFRLQDN